MCFTSIKKKKLLYAQGIRSFDDRYYIKSKHQVACVKSKTVDQCCAVGKVHSTLTQTNYCRGVVDWKDREIRARVKSLVLFSKQFSRNFEICILKSEKV